MAPSAVPSPTVTPPRTSLPPSSPSVGPWWPGGRTASGEIAAGDFFTGYFESALAPDEVVTEVRVPKVGSAGFDYQKFNRAAQYWAIVGVAVARYNGSTGVAVMTRDPRPCGPLPWRRRSPVVRRRPRRPSTPPTAPSRPPI